MLVAVTDRVELCETLRAACAAVPLYGGRGPTFEAVTDIGDVLPMGLAVSVLALDLELCAKDPNFAEYFRTWHTLNGACANVLLDTMLDRSRHGQFIFSLGAIPGRDVFAAGTRLRDVQWWCELLRNMPAGQVVRGVRDQIEQALRCDLPNRALIGQLLVTAVNYQGTVKELTKRLHGAEESADSTQRGRVARVLRRAKQPSAHAILSAFRVLLYARLMMLAEGEPGYWNAARRAAVLGAPNHKALKRSLARCSGLPFNTLRRVDYNDVFHACLALLEPGRAETLSEALRGGRPRKTLL